MAKNTVKHVKGSTRTRTMVTHPGSTHPAIPPYPGTPPHYPSMLVYPATPARGTKEASQASSGNNGRPKPPFWLKPDCFLAKKGHVQNCTFCRKSLPRDGQKRKKPVFDVFDENHCFCHFSGDTTVLRVFPGF